MAQHITLDGKDYVILSAEEFNELKGETQPVAADRDSNEFWRSLFATSASPTACPRPQWRGLMGSPLAYAKRAVPEAALTAAEEADRFFRLRQIDLNIQTSADEGDDDEAFAITAWNAHQAELAAGRSLSMKKEEWARIRDGESPIRVVREHRGMTQAQLADTSGIARPEISAIESGKRRGTVDSYKAIAKALGTSIDVLVGE